MNDRYGQDVVVVGAGIVGLSVALMLQRKGIKVLLLDPLGPGGGASYGNAGLLSVSSALPVALPGMIKKVPGWLLDRTGPLTIPAAYFPRLLPWLIKWILAGRRSQIHNISAALHALHGEALSYWEKLLSPAEFGRLVRVDGHVQLWENATPTSSAKLEQQVRQRFNIPAHSLSSEQLNKKISGLGPESRQGLFLPRNGHLIDPQHTLFTLTGLFEQAGGALRRERVCGIYPDAKTRKHLIITNNGNYRAPNLVIAAGAWSQSLMTMVGLKVPLETERGYHAMLPEPSIQLACPVNDKSHGLALTPMRGGLRIAGTVEFGGLDGPLNIKRARQLVVHAKRLFPGIEHGVPNYWMGYRPSLPDSLPVLSRLPGHAGIFLAFGHGHFGMTSGPASASVLTALITGETSPIDPVPYDVRRFL